MDRLAVISSRGLRKGLCQSQITTLCRNLKSAFSSRPVLDLSGVYPPIITPFDDNENISFDRLESNVSKWNQMNFRGLVVQGSNGEYAYLKWEERIELVKKVGEMKSKDKLLIAGSGCESTRDTVEMTSKMADAGADAVMVVTPCFYKGAMKNSALIAHYTKVADQSSVPVIVYSVPANTGIDLSPEVVIELSKHPNIIGLKDSGGDVSKIGHIVYRTQDNSFQVLAGSAGFLLPALSIGCVGGVLALANVLGPQTCRLFELYQNGKLEEAKSLQHRLIQPNTAVTKVYSVSGLKKSMEWFGLHGGPVRSPMQPLTETETAKLKKIFTSTGFLKD